MRRLFLLLLLLLVGPAWADSGMMMMGVSNRQMELDALPAATAAYSIHRLRTAYVANKAVNIVRASDSATSDVGFDAYGRFDTATATTFCNATTCKLVTWYDQVGSNNLTQATDANRYTVQFTSLGTFPAFQATAATQTHAGGSNITPATGVVSFATVARRSSGTASCTWIRENGLNNRIRTTNGANTWEIIGGTSGSLTSAADSAWHTAGVAINGASSAVSIDGSASPATGTVTGNTTAGVPAIVGVASTTCNQVEQSIWDAAALTTAQYQYLYAFQHGNSNF